VLVSNGVYKTGSRVVPGGITQAMSNRVAVTKPLTLLSVNGPAVTTILGARAPGQNIFSYGAVRCVYLTNGAVLSGFTLTNGTTIEAGFDSEQLGGGVYCESTSATVSNCVLTGNVAYLAGGGTESGTLYNCTLIGNSAGTNGNNGGGGGADSSVLNNCLLVGNSAPYGGAYAFTGTRRLTLDNCTIRGNSAQNGGGVYGKYLCSLKNCTLSGNTATVRGGGNFGCTMTNCTVTGNSAANGGGTYDAEGVFNCIIYDNNAPTNANYDSLTALNYSCTTPLSASGPGNFTSPPLFVNQAGGDFHLQSNSPCINSGNNSYFPGTFDLDGNPRIQGGTVDAGAYEFQNPASVISYAWLQQYGLLADGTADFADSDGDGLNNWQEWVAGTNPTDVASTLRMQGASNSASGITVSWQSVTNRNYYLQRASNLDSTTLFQLVNSNVVGHTGATSYADTNAAGPGPFFYRVGVQ
jgi:hypothetical protein